MRPLVLAFLTKAAKQRKFHVIVAERAPERDARCFVRLFDDVIVSDVQMFPIMSCVNKVVAGAKTAVSSGGIETFVGAASLASPPKFYSVPVDIHSSS
ncbi:hypothetical protein O3P69_013494 [Scylla paramamosain]|uniref:Translation initiation factor eIF2B subunit beta n=1 Tax=Scylla paramamosain TaxID=85552 RepID=A0AAW0SDL4_SCYPA